MIRLMDIFISIIFLPCYLAIILVGVIVKLFIDGRPIFYVSKRCVKNLKEIKIYKFRTMINDRELIEQEVSLYTRNGFEAIPLESKIYTPLGRLYERFQLVELPQFLNILMGSLSLVGYRPLPLRNVNNLIDDFGLDIIVERHKHMPGLTGYCQLFGKINLSPMERLNLEIKLNKNLYEVGLCKAMFTYFTLIFDTALVIFFDKTYFLDREKLID